MAHIVIDPETLHHHTGTSHAGEVGFYTFLGFGAVGIALLTGIYWLAQNALQGVAALASGL